MITLKLKYSCEDSNVQDLILEYMKQYTHVFRVAYNKLYKQEKLKQADLLKLNNIDLLDSWWIAHLLPLYGDKVIKNSQLYTLFYNEITKLLNNFNILITKSYTFKYNGQLYLIMNVINNTFIKLSKPYLNDNDVIKLTEHLKLFNTKFVNILH